MVGNELQEKLFGLTEHELGLFNPTEHAEPGIAAVYVRHHDTGSTGVKIFDNGESYSTRIVSLKPKRYTDIEVRTETRDLLTTRKIRHFDILGAAINRARVVRNIHRALGDLATYAAETGAPADIEQTHADTSRLFER